MAEKLIRASKSRHIKTKNIQNYIIVADLLIKEIEASRYLVVIRYKTALL